MEDEGKQEEKFDFTAEGEALGYISMDQAQVLAMRTAREMPGAYGPNYVDVPMAFDVVESDDTEDHYRVTLSFRPEGTFTGTPGQEQFFIEKEGTIGHRQVLSLPGQARWWRSRMALMAVVITVFVAVAAGGVIATIGRGGSGDAAPLASASPTSTPEPPGPTPPPPAPTAAPVVAPPVSLSATPISSPAVAAMPVATLTPTGSAVPTPPLTPARNTGVSPTPAATISPTTGSTAVLPTPSPGTLPLLVFQNGLPLTQLGIAEYSGVQDSYIAQGEPSTNFERETSVFAKADPSENIYGLATLIRFDLSAPPKDTEISRATLELYRHPNSFAASATILVSKLIAPVALEAVTQNNLDRSIIGPQIASFQVESLPEYGGSWHEVDITDVVRNWVRDPAGNHGLFLDQKSGAILGPEVAFFSADYTSDGTP